MSLVRVNSTAEFGAGGRDEPDAADAQQLPTNERAVGAG